LSLYFQEAKSNINRFRWILFAIVISGLLMDLQLSLGISPYPLLPHIAFWADGLLVQIHRRAIVYLMALVLLFIYLWVTTMLLAFLFRLEAVMEKQYKKIINRFSYVAIALCAFNTSMSCGILLLKYPSQSRIDAYLMEKIPTMKFLLESPGFIYFAKMDQFHFAQIGMAHLIVCSLLYSTAFVGIFVIINLSLFRVRYLMSKNTRNLHYMLFKSLVAQMLLPLFSMVIPFILTALSIRFGREDDGIDHQYVETQTLKPRFEIIHSVIGHFSILLASLHSILNTLSMFMFVLPFRRYLSSRVSPMGTVATQTPSKTNSSSAAIVAP
ncbi:hypothetical protein PENTCL1PPCAC_21898, partial [Pristionchus entomophagus]